MLRHRRLGERQLVDQLAAVAAVTREQQPQDVHARGMPERLCKSGEVLVTRCRAGLPRPISRVCESHRNSTIKKESHSEHRRLTASASSAIPQVEDLAAQERLHACRCGRAPGPSMEQVFDKRLRSHVYLVADRRGQRRCPRPTGRAVPVPVADSWEERTGVAATHGDHDVSGRGRPRRSTDLRRLRGEVDPDPRPSRPRTATGFISAAGC